MSTKLIPFIFIFIFALSNTTHADDFLETKINFFNKTADEPELQNSKLKDIKNAYGSDFIFVDPLQGSIDPGIYSTHGRKKSIYVSENENPLAHVKRICEEDFQRPPLSDLEITSNDFGPVKNIKIPYGSYKHHHIIYDSQEQIIWSADNLSMIRYKNPELAAKIIRGEIKKTNACNAEVRENVHKKNSVFIATGVVTADGYTEYKRPRHKLFGRSVEWWRGNVSKFKEASTIISVKGLDLLEFLNPIVEAAAEERHKSLTGNSLKGKTAVALEVNAHPAGAKNKQYRRHNLEEDDLEEFFGGL